MSDKLNALQMFSLKIEVFGRAFNIYVQDILMEVTRVISCVAIFFLVFVVMTVHATPMIQEFFGSALIVDIPLFISITENGFLYHTVFDGVPKVTAALVAFSIADAYATLCCHFTKRNEK